MTTTNNEWEDRLKPKVTIFSEEDEWRKEIAMQILNAYWKDLEPEIRKERDAVRTETIKDGQQKIEEIIAEPTELADVKIYNQGVKDAINYLTNLDTISHSI